MPKTTIKVLIKRKRLKFSNNEIAYYLYKFIEHTAKSLNFRYIYENDKKNKHITCAYTNFMNNLQTLAPLLTVIYQNQKKDLRIKANDDFNIVDTTLIPTKQEYYITQKDWNNNNVTTRTKKVNKKDIKVHTCGKKGLFMINSQKYIYFAKLLNINNSAQNIFKDLMIYHVNQCFNGTMLMDRGFTNKAVRERFNYIGINIISPNHYKINTFFTPNQHNLYKKRWKIETVFQSLKNKYSKVSLNLCKFYNLNMINAKFLATVLLFNQHIHEN
jgi:hypothetical protein